MVRVVMEKQISNHILTFQMFQLGALVRKAEIKKYMSLYWVKCWQAGVVVMTLAWRETAGFIQTFLSNLLWLPQFVLFMPHFTLKCRKLELIQTVKLWKQTESHKTYCETRVCDKVCRLTLYYKTEDKLTTTLTCASQPNRRLNLW